MPELINFFFERMYESMRLPFPKLSIPIILPILDYFMQKDPDQTIISMINHNFFFVLLWNIEHESIREFLFKLIDLPKNPYSLGLTNSLKISKYLKHTDFFADFCKFIFYPDHVIDIRKCETLYRPPKLSKVYDLNQNTFNNVVKKSKHRSTVRLINPKPIQTLSD